MTHPDEVGTRAMGPSPAELTSAIRLYEQALPPGVRRTFDIQSLDTLAMPVIFDALVPPWGTWIDGFGYGATLDEARVGALGELSESAHLTRALLGDPGVLASWAEMVQREGAERVIDPRRLALAAGCGWTEETPMRWVRVRRWPEGDAWAPRDFVAHNRHAYHAAACAEAQAIAPCITPITNGLGAGASLEQALAHGVLELLQRDGNTTRFRAMDRGIVIDIDAARDPGVRALLATLRSCGVDPVAKLASVEFGIVNLYVVDGGAAEPLLPIQATACGEAAHPNAERALRKALLELMAARCRKAMMHGPLERIAAFAGDAYLTDVLTYADPDAEEPRALQAMDEWMSLSTAALRARLRDTVLSTTRRVALTDLPSTPDAAVQEPTDRLAALSRRLTDRGHDIFYYNASPGGEGPAVVKALVVGLECETMSYHRVGLRGILRLMVEDAPDGGGPLAGVGSAPDGARRVVLTEADVTSLGGEAWLATARIDAIVGALYPLYREPASHTVQLSRRRTCVA